MQAAAFNHQACPIHVGVPGVNGGQGNPIATVHYGGPGAGSATKEAVESQAEFMVRACNAHDDLVAACENALHVLTPAHPKMDGLDRTRMWLREAIKKAKGTGA